MTVESPGFSGKPLNFVNFSVGNPLEAEMFWNAPVSVLIIPAKPASGISAGGDPCLLLDLRLTIFLVRLQSRSCWFTVGKITYQPGNLLVYNGSKTKYSVINIFQYLTLSLTPPLVEGFFLSCSVSLVCCVVPVTYCDVALCRRNPIPLLTPVIVWRGGGGGCQDEAQQIDDSWY